MNSPTLEKAGLSSRISLQARVPAEMALERLDRTASKLFPEFSRARLQSWIKSGELVVDGQSHRPKDKLSGGELLQIDAEGEQRGYLAQDIALDVVYEDDALVVINKPPGLVVHPGAGNVDGTMLNALLYRYPDLDEIPRAGIVHRLDKDTSGLLVVARTLQSQNELVKQLQSRRVKRVYEAIAFGAVDASGSISGAIGRHPVSRTRMALRTGGKAATTHYRCLKNFDGYSHVELSLETGRSHQIRVHMESIGHPLVGDPVYRSHMPRIRNRSEAVANAVDGMERQALHAKLLSFVHPDTADQVTFESKLPCDMIDLLEVLTDAV